MKSSALLWLETYVPMTVEPQEKLVKLTLVSHPVTEKQAELVRKNVTSAQQVLFGLKERAQVRFSPRNIRI